jgi:hypothetical protein
LLSDCDRYLSNEPNALNKTELRISLLNPPLTEGNSKGNGTAVKNNRGKGLISYPATWVKFLVREWQLRADPRSLGHANGTPQEVIIFHSLCLNGEVGASD